MKYYLIVMCLVLFGALETKGEMKQERNERTRLVLFQDKASYTIGRNLGVKLRRDELQINRELLIKGLEDGLSGALTFLTEEQIQSVVADLREHHKAKKQERFSAGSEANKERSREFLVANANRKEVIVLPNGLQYEIINRGTGRVPGSGDYVNIHYRSSVIGDEVVVCTYGRKEPVRLQVSNTIDGLREALELMQEGAKWKIYVPPQLAYGANGNGGMVGPNAVLICEIELISIQDNE
ncbi:FKBP-type peptidyl-prolyl cis-trans isomerase N-terminal domain-containing protein [Acidobacteriota bacterium]